MKINLINKSKVLVDKSGDGRFVVTENTMKNLLTSSDNKRNRTNK